MAQHSHILSAHVSVFPLGSSSAEVREPGCGALLSSLSSNLAHHLAGSEIVLFFIINLSVPQYPIWEKKQILGMDPVWESNLGALHCSLVLHFPGYLYISAC